MISPFRRSRSTPGCFSSSIQKSLKHASAGSREFDAANRTTLKSKYHRAGHDNRERKMEENPCSFSRSRSCGFELSYIEMEECSPHRCKNTSQDVLISSDSNSHVGSNGFCGGTRISSNCCLNDASPTYSASCPWRLIAHAAGAIDVGIAHHPADSLELVTWNLARPNNNPFEFWVRTSRQIVSRP
jgi:hypothetical protein